MGHASMSMFTAFSLSFRNLLTKRFRTILIAFAGSIGIIGIARIAAHSSGVDDDIYQQEAKMAYQSPFLVETLNTDVSAVLSDLNGNLAESGQEKVEVIGFLKKLFAMPVPWHTYAAANHPQIGRLPNGRLHNKNF